MCYKLEHGLKTPDCNREKKCLEVIAEHFNLHATIRTGIIHEILKLKLERKD